VSWNSQTFHTCSLQHATPSLAITAQHVKCLLACMLTVQTITLFTVFVMVIIQITTTTAVAWNMVPTLASKEQHHTCLLAYHANHCTNCNTVYPGYHTNHNTPTATALAWDMVLPLANRVHYLWVNFLIRYFLTTSLRILNSMNRRKSLLAQHLYQNSFLSIQQSLSWNMWTDRQMGIAYNVFHPSTSCQECITTEPVVKWPLENLCHLCSYYSLHVKIWLRSRFKT
jgi:hypothetical protein